MKPASMGVGGDCRFNPKTTKRFEMMIDRLNAHMQALQMLSRAQELVADNLANINTPGFKGGTFLQHLQEQRIDGRTVHSVTPGVRMNLEQGQLEPTGNRLDIGIEGDGFFMVEEEGRTRLTRDGRFRIGPEGFLVDSRGSRVMGRGGPIYIPDAFHVTGQAGMPEEFDVATDGTIRLNGERFDQLRIVRVDDSSHLERRGGSYLAVADEGHLAEDERSRVMQGYYEKANVEPLKEMVQMMRTMQMFEAQQRAMRSTDEVLGQVSGSLARF